MIDIVIPFKRGGSHTGDLELRYSLRSVEANLRISIGTVYILGYKLSWLRNVVAVAVEDRKDKAVNLMAKYQLACDTAAISDPFLLMDDDHVFLQPTAEIPIYTWGMLGPVAAEKRGSYGRYLRNSLELLTANGLPTRNYQIHYPMLVRKDVLRRAIALATIPAALGSLYGNLVDGPTVELTHDYKPKLVGGIDGLRDGAFVSLSDSTICHAAVKSWLAARFPTPSRWEAA